MPQDQNSIDAEDLTPETLADTSIIALHQLNKLIKRLESSIKPDDVRRLKSGIHQYGVLLEKEVENQTLRTMRVDVGLPAKMLEESLTFAACKAVEYAPGYGPNGREY